MATGGKRTGTRWPKGGGKYGKYNEPAKVTNLSISIVPCLNKMADKTIKIPLFASKVSAGFPSPAEDYLAATLDLNHYLIKHPAATFLVRAIGHSMINAGIHENDLSVFLDTNFFNKTQPQQHNNIFFLFQFQPLIQMI